MSKILTTIISCEKNKERRDVCRSSYLKTIPNEIEHFFISSKIDNDTESDVRLVNAPDGYIELPQKVIATAKLALTIDGWEWWNKLDDDVLYLGDRVLDMINNVPENTNVVVYKMLNDAHKSWSAGFCYFMKRQVVEAIVKNHESKKYLIPDKGLEDRSMHFAARFAGYELFGSDRISAKVLPTKENNIAAKHFWKINEIKECYDEIYGGSVLPQC